MSFNDRVIEEIGLEGLDGITIPALWLRLSTCQPPFSLKLDPQSKEFIWNEVICPHPDFEFYRLPQPRPPVAFKQRFSTNPEELAECTSLLMEGDDPYPVHPIKDEVHGIFGSCLTYKTRVNITEDIRDSDCTPKLTLEQAEEKYGEQMAIVASQKQRSFSLLMNEEVGLNNMSAIYYAVLERIGRSRWNGELTQGKQSLLSVMKVGSKSLFYIVKNVLGPLNVIAQQNVYVRTADKLNAHCKLIHLKRFKVQYIPLNTRFMIRVSDYLLQQPSQTENLNDLRVKLNISQKQMKKVLNTFTKNVVLNQATIREDFIYKDGKSKERNVKVRSVQLIAPFSVEEYMLDEEEEKEHKDEHLEEDSQVKPWATTSTFHDLTIMHQVYAYARSRQELGISIREGSRLFKIPRLDSRLLCRTLTRLKAATEFMWDKIKQREQRFVVHQFVGESAIHQKLLNESHIIQTPAEPMKTDNDDDLDANLVKALEPPGGKRANVVTYRMLKRANFILNAIKEAKVIENIFLLRKAIIEEEQQAGWKHSLDRKSLIRLLNRMTSAGQICQIIQKVTLQAEDCSKTKQIHLLHAVDIAPDDPLIKSVIETQRLHLMTPSKEDLRKERREKKQGKEAPAAKPVVDKRKLLASAVSTNSMEYDSSMGVQYGFQPRMRRLQIVHELLWYLTYGMSNPGTSYSDFEHMSSSEAEGSTFSMDDLHRDRVFCEQISWKRFLPPLPQHSGYSRGWCLIGDVLLVLPVSIFCQVIRVNYKIKGLTELLADPINRNLTMCQLPSLMRQQLMHERKYIFSFNTICDSLCRQGLLTYGKKNFKEKTQIFVYVHKKASMLDSTVMKQPSEWPPLLFTFKSMEDINMYWFKLQCLCFSTPSESLAQSEAARAKNVTRGENARFLECLLPKDVNAIVDEGHLPGDHLGAAGTDSSFFCHLRRNWCLIRTEVEPVSLVHSQFVSERRRKRKRKDSSVSDDEEESPKKSPRKKQTLAKETKIAANKVPLKPINTEARFPFPAPKKPKIRKREKPAKRGRIVSAEDEKAISMMHKQRVKWTKKENTLLLLCQVAQNFLFGCRRDFVPPYGVVRDILQETFKASLDKSSLACARRMKHMMKFNDTQRNVQIYLQEAMQDEALVNEYKKGKTYTKSDKSNSVPINITAFRNVVSKLQQKFSDTQDPVTASVRLPATREELFDKFTINPLQPKKADVPMDVRDQHNIYFCVILNLVQASMLIGDKKSCAPELFQLFSQYPENLLSRVLNFMKEERIITKIKRSQNLKKSMQHSAIGTYHPSQRYTYIWLSRYPKTMFTEAAQWLGKIHPGKEGKELQLLNNMSQTAMLVSLMATRQIKFRVQVPHQIVVVDSKVTQEEQKNLSEMEQHLKEIEEETDEEEEEEEEEVKRRTYVPNARSLHFLVRSHYVHGQCLRNISAQEFLVVNSCNIHVSFKREASFNPTPRPILEDAFEREIQSQLTEYNGRPDHVQLHPETAEKVLSIQRKLFPSKIKFNSLLKCLRSQNWAENDLEDLTKVNEVIKSHDIYGVTLYDLQNEVNVRSSNNLQRYLDALLHHKAVLRVGLSDHRYIAFEHSRAWLIHSYKKVGDNMVDLVDGSRMEQLLKAPIQAGKSWPEPVNVEGDEEGEVNRKRKAAEEEEEEEEEGQGKRLRVEDQSEICFEEGPARDENSAAEDILSQPGVHNTFYGTPNAAELMSGNRAKKNVEEKRKRKEEQKAKEKLKLKEEEEKRKEEEERERKKAEEERKRRQAEEEEIIAAEMRREADEAAEEEEETEDKIEVVIQSRTPDEPPGGEELMVLAKMAKTQNRQPPACRKAKQLPKRNTRVRATTSTCPEAQHLVALARLAEQDKKKASKKPRSVTRKTSPPAAQPPKTPEAKKLVSVLKPDIRKKLPQVDGPGEDAAENTYLGSFNRVRLVCRPWRVPSGGINRPVLRLMLEAVCMQTITRPGVTVQSLFTFFQPALHITPILELVEILECVGCVERKFIQRESRSSLFSKRIVYSDVPCGSNLQAEAAIIPKIDCILKLGHFLQMLSEDF